MFACAALGTSEVGCGPRPRGSLYEWLLFRTRFGRFELNVYVCESESEALIVFNSMRWQTFIP